MTAPLYGILTGGGDCPGLNAVIRIVVKKLLRRGARVLGIRDGFEGLLGAGTRELTADDVSGILSRGGTILGTSNRGDPVKDGPRLMEVWKKFGLEGVVAIGGDGTMLICQELTAFGARFVGVPKTIDNDVVGTDVTFGFDTAVACVANAVDALHSTADAHRRIMVVEVMGRKAGWIALYGGMAGGADVILLPEKPFDLDAVAAHIRERHQSRRFTIVVAAEGAKPKGGDTMVQRVVKDAREQQRLGGVGAALGIDLEERTGHETRVTVLGHLQRGGAPTPADRILASRLGAAAADLALGGEWGKLVVVRGGGIASIPISEIAGRRKTVPVDHELIRAGRDIGVFV